jgi:hypothetical protein
MPPRRCRRPATAFFTDHDYALCHDPLPAPLCPRLRSTVISAKIDIAISSDVIAPRSRPADASTRSSVDASMPSASSPHERSNMRGSEKYEIPDVASLIRATLVLPSASWRVWYKRVSRRKSSI